jgi:hypothetical protein
VRETHDEFPVEENLGVAANEQGGTGDRCAVAADVNAAIAN